MNFYVIIYQAKQTIFPTHKLPQEFYFKKLIYKATDIDNNNSLAQTQTHYFILQGRF